MKNLTFRVLIDMHYTYIIVIDAYSSKVFVQQKYSMFCLSYVSVFAVLDPMKILKKSNRIHE